MMGIWEKAIKPTLYDYVGEVLVCSNSAGKNPDNFLYNFAPSPKRLKKYHATTLDDPLLPERLPDETREAWLQRRHQLRAALIKDTDPLVYAQEHLAELSIGRVSVSFAREKLLDQGKPVPIPRSLRRRICDHRYGVKDRH